MRRGTATAVPTTMLVVAVAMALSVAPAAAGTDAGSGWLGSSGDGLAGAVPLVTLQPAGALPGIDVSHHQGTIDWVQVAAAGTRFAIAKATDGRTFVDPEYATNRSGAEGNGIVFGAYHFARPDDGANDAIGEADHFVDTAQLAPGNLIPVLDIERTGGLTQAQVTQWVLDWLDRVTERLGVRPMIYTSPNGWANRTGDTTAVVQAGYTVLWVAHWGVAEPRVPAQDWGGYSWTFWQYTSHGSVPGIDGDVDLDWYRFGDLTPVVIPSPDVTPPNVTLSPPADVDEPVTVSFDEAVHQVTTQNTFIWTPSTGTYPASSIACRSRTGASVDCVTGRVRTALVQPVDPLVPGESYEAVVNPAVAPVLVVDRGGNPAPTTTLPFSAATQVEQDSPAVTYVWREAHAPRALGGSYAVERSRGAVASFLFGGRSITWLTAVGPSMGKARVSIDGVERERVDLYAPATRFRVERTFDRLGGGAHTIAIKVLGTAAARADDTRVVVDGFQTRTDRLRSPRLDERWATSRAAHAGEAGYASSDLAGAMAEITFRGTGIEWRTVRGPDQGRAELYVDGLLVRTVDNFATEPMFGVVRSAAGLADGLHTLRIVVLGDARRASDGTAIAVDGFAVLPG